MLEHLLTRFQSNEKYIELSKNIEKSRVQLLHGLSDEGLAFLCYNLLQNSANKILVLTPDEWKAKDIKTLISGYTDKVEQFVQKELMLYNVDALSKDKIYKRVNTIAKIINEDKLIITASSEAIMTRIVDKDRFKNSVLEFNYNDRYDFDELKTKLIDLGYDRVDFVEGKGQFSVRGGIIDVFTSDSDNPYRIEFFDDEIDSIRLIDKNTQRSIDSIDEISIYPLSDMFFGEKEKKIIEEELKLDYQKRLRNISKADNNDRHLKNIEELISTYINKFEGDFQFDNAQLLSVYMKNNLSNILDYFDKNTIILIYEPDKFTSSIKGIEENFQLKFLELFEKGQILSQQSDIYYKKEEVYSKIDNHKKIYFNSLLKTNKNILIDDVIQILSKEPSNYYGKMEDLANDLNRYLKKKYSIKIVLNSEETCKKIATILEDYEISTVLSFNDEAVIDESIILTVGKASKGIEFPLDKLIILTENEVFGTVTKKKKKKKRKNARKIDAFTDLKIGDYVVHEFHGIGQYVGIENIEIGGIKKDYLKINYKGKDVLYVPVDQLSAIQKYIGSDSASPKVSKMSSQEWKKTKAKTKKAIEDMAKELIQLYAKRRKLKGYAYPEDDIMQKDFEYRFPFDETDDQLKCIEDIKTDMEKAEPMDRLLCGDVGFGKTEVALRAVFKAISAGKQVAILVPTTILAQQHYTTIIDRFRGFPVKVGMLSRFKNAKEQENIIKNVNKGLCDIVVGTHRLLSKSIRFKDLGLLVIDEEQRFGVKHKETIKEFKSNIDVLCLSATPIPRTLHMSMIGIRDMSIIQEPPHDRIEIQTYVIEENEGIIRDAIEREMSRGGQIFYVHNQVKDIESVANRLRKLVPEAKVCIGHGQLDEKSLENMMVDFVEKKYDILVCTTIIETGMDIPNVNTLIIDNADKFGLSQLYQLRGRVGRSNKTSYAYLTYRKDKILTEIASKRLKAIKEFTEFGSGFKIAMRDLEIRGSGNVLGHQQHGHMMAIGYDLYVKYLEQAVKKLSGEELEYNEIEMTVELNVDGFIPGYYIANEETKIEMYKRIASIENEEDVLDVNEELIDRFGDIPRQAGNLIKIAFIKSLCKQIGIKDLLQSGKMLQIEFTSAIKMTDKIMDYLMKNQSKKIRFDMSSKDPKMKYVLTAEKKQKEILKEVTALLSEMKEANEKED